MNICLSLKYIKQVYYKTPVSKAGTYFNTDQRETMGWNSHALRPESFHKAEFAASFHLARLGKQSTQWWLQSLHNSQSFEYFVTRQIVQASRCHALLLLLPQIFPRGFEEETLDRNSVCWEGRAIIPSGLRPVQRSATTTAYQQVVMAVMHRSQSSPLQIFPNTDSP